jgi:hypothetical protein
MNNDLSWNDAREARLDRAIDRAVREMMQLDPPPGLRRRVLSRLNGPVERRAYPYLWYGLATAALSVFVVVSLIPGPVEPPSPPKAPSLTFATDLLPVTPGPETIVVPEVNSPGGRAPAAGITKEPIRMPLVTNVFGTRSGEASAATVPSNEPARPTRPQDLAPLTIVPLSARPIVVEPLVIPAPPKGGQ